MLALIPNIYFKSSWITDDGVVSGMGRNDTVFTEPSNKSTGVWDVYDREDFDCFINSPWFNVGAGGVNIFFNTSYPRAPVLGFHGRIVNSYMHPLAVESLLGFVNLVDIPDFSKTDFLMLENDARSVYDVGSFFSFRNKNLRFNEYQSLGTLASNESISLGFYPYSFSKTLEWQGAKSNGLNPPRHSLNAKQNEKNFIEYYSKQVGILNKIRG